jgi:hypothetical protein
MTEPTKATRTTHTPAEKATEAVNVLQRRLDKLNKAKAAFELQALEVEPQIVAMQKRLDYALSNPDLPIETTATIPETPEPPAAKPWKTTSAEEFHAQVTGAPWPTEPPTA